MLIFPFIAVAPSLLPEVRFQAMATMVMTRKIPLLILSFVTCLVMRHVQAMVALQVILQMARVLDGTQVHPLVVHLRHVVLLVVLVAARVVACLGVAVMIENMVLAGTREILVRL